MQLLPSAVFLLGVHAVFHGRLLLVEALVFILPVALWAAVPLHRLLLLNTPARFVPPFSWAVLRYGAQWGVFFLAAIVVNQVSWPLERLFYAFLEPAFSAGFHEYIFLHRLVEGWPLVGKALFFRLSFWLPAVATGAGISAFSFWRKTRGTWGLAIFFVLFSELLPLIVLGLERPLTAAFSPNAGAWVFEALLLATVYIIFSLGLVLLSAGWAVLRVKDSLPAPPKLP